MLIFTVQELTHIATAMGGEVLFAGVQDNANCYFVLYGGDAPNSGIYRLINGTAALLVGGISRVPVSGDTIRFTVDGSLLKLEIIAAGTVVASTQITDTTSTGAGKCGIGDAYGGATTDDYKLREL